jgi:CRP-like cAMP-binding protein
MAELRDEPGPALNLKLSVLRKHPLFSELDGPALDQLCRYAKGRTFKRGATIFSKGDPGNALFVVVSGTVKISVSSADGRSAILNLIGEGESFGEIALLDGLARTTDAIANASCEILMIDRREFMPFVRTQPSLAIKLIELLCTRLRWSSEQIEQLILHNLPGRLANALVRLMEKRQPVSPGQSVAITQQEISEMVGTTRESINKQLRVWAANNWVRIEHGTIVIIDSRPLAMLAKAMGEND